MDAENLDRDEGRQSDERHAAERQRHDLRREITRQAPIAMGRTKEETIAPLATPPESKAIP